VELYKEINPREQSRHRGWNPDRGSRNKIPRRWQSAGEYGADGDEYGGGVSGVVSGEESNHKTLVISYLRTIATTIEKSTAKKTITGTSLHCVDGATFLFSKSLLPSCKDE